MLYYVSGTVAVLEPGLAVMHGEVRALRAELETPALALQAQAEHAVSQTCTFDVVGVSVVFNPVLTCRAPSFQAQDVATMQQGQRAEAGMAQVPAIGDGPGGVGVIRGVSRA